MVSCCLFSNSSLTWKMQFRFKLLGFESQGSTRSDAGARHLGQRGQRSPVRGRLPSLSHHPPHTGRKVFRLCAPLLQLAHGWTRQFHEYEVKLFSPVRRCVTSSSTRTSAPSSSTSSSSASCPTKTPSGTCSGFSGLSTTKSRTTGDDSALAFEFQTLKIILLNPCVISLHLPQAARLSLI